MKRRRLSPVALALAVAAAPFLPAACGESTVHPPQLDTDVEGGRLPPPRPTTTADHFVPDTSKSDVTQPDAGNDAAVDAPTDAVVDAPVDASDASPDAADAQDASDSG